MINNYYKKLFILDEVIVALNEDDSEAIGVVLTPFDIISTKNLFASEVIISETIAKNYIISVCGIRREIKIEKKFNVQDTAVYIEDRTKDFKIYTDKIKIVDAENDSETKEEVDRIVWGLVD